MKQRKNITIGGEGMARNTLGDLNNHLFMQLERLGDEELTEEQLEKEINRTKAITSVAKEVISNANLVLRARMQVQELTGDENNLPKMLKG